MSWLEKQANSPYLYFTNETKTPPELPTKERHPLP